MTELVDEDKAFSALINPSQQSIDDLFASIHSTEHAANAIDFEDEDELADEELPEEEESTMKKEEEEEDDLLGELEREGKQVDSEDEAQQNAEDQFDNLFGGDDDNDHMLHFKEETNDEADFDGLDLEFDETVLQVERAAKLELQERDEARRRELQRLAQEKKRKRELKLLKQYYPDFQRDSVLKLNKLFGPKPAQFKYHQSTTRIKPLLPLKVKLEVDMDQRKVFKSLKSKHINDEVHGQKIISVNEEQLQSWFPSLMTIADNKKSQFDEFSKDLILSTTDWNDDVILNAGESETEKEETQRSSKKHKLNKYDDWLDDDEQIFDGAIANGNLNLRLDMNDPNLLFMPDRRKINQSNHMMTRAKIPKSDRYLSLKFNISNDRAYEALKENYHSKIRSTIGNLTIDHSVPAIKLQTPYYKVKLTKNQLRSFHRPNFYIRPGTIIIPSKVKQRKKKKDKGKEIKELFSDSADLTLADSAQLFAMEYSEELPPILSNFGMASKLINYYRKLNDDDTTRPKLLVGETSVLGVSDRSPFWNFGIIEPGNVVPTLYNNMIRAPIFKHEVKSTDFLLLRSSGNGNFARFYMRPINHMFTVGQAFPVLEVPAPHSRKVTTTSKSRLKMIVFRVINKNGESRLAVKDISNHFPDQNDMQNRQRLKEFMEYQRQGEDQGYWKVKNDHIPEEEEVRAMITPEDVSILESMQVGQQLLEDTGFYFRADAESDSEALSIPTGIKDKDKEGDSTEEQLAPWNTTKNFINATQGKAMIQVHGEGDPTGVGLGFSFLKTSMKGGFKASESTMNQIKEEREKEKEKSKGAGHSYTVAFQQKAYDEEIAKTWYAQSKSLSISNDAELRKQYEELGGANEQGDDKANDLENSSRNKFLKITRRVKDENGTVQRKIEIIRDPKVIKAYIKRKQKIEDEDLDAEDIFLTNDEEKNKRHRKLLEEQIAKLEKNQERRKARKANKEKSGGSNSSGGNPPVMATINGEVVQISGKGIGKGKSKTRRCATCGSVGHIRTNKTCPLYGQPPNPNYASQHPTAMNSPATQAPTPLPNANGNDPGVGDGENGQGGSPVFEEFF